MTRHHNGDTVKAGFYFNLASWEVQALSGQGGEIKGKPGEPWVRVPAFLLLVLAPVMGAAYVVFLPFIGIAMVLNHLFGKATAAVRGPQVRLADTARGREQAGQPAERRDEEGTSRRG